MISRFFRTFALPAGMLTGLAGYSVFYRASFIMPFLLFIMMFLAFTGGGVRLREMKPGPLHIKLLLFQLISAGGFFFLIRCFNPMLAEAVLICIIGPTAVAAAVVAQRLGGSTSVITTYTVLSNFMAAAVIPVIFPLLEGRSCDFFELYLIILEKVFFMIIMPLLCSVFLNRFFPKISAAVKKHSGVSFYIWSFSLIILTSTVIHSLVSVKESPGMTVMISLGALFSCLYQFIFGRLAGRRYGHSITAGQSLGQKNTILMLWLSTTYLSPVIAIGPGTYMLWQNTINAWQLWRKARADGSSAS